MLYYERNMFMKFGMCLELEKLKKSKEYGADYAEVNCCQVYSLGNSEFVKLKKHIADENIVTYSCNGLVPADVRLTGDVKLDKIREYAKISFDRLAELGVTLLVFGSSAAKNVPEGFSFEKAWDQLYEVGAIFSDVAAQNGQTVAVEPLNRFEVNIVNTIEDAASYAKAVNRDNFKILADFYHVNKNEEPLSDIVKYKDLLVHTHIASKERYVITASDRDFTASCLNTLKEAGYNGGVSFEGLGSDDANATEMFKILKELG